MSFVGKNIDKALDRTRARTPTARAIIAQLARHANSNLLARPSQGLLARRAGINTRQVRKLLRELEDLGEILPVRKGANKPTEFRLTILSDEVVDRHCGAEPAVEMDRHSTTGPKNRGTGTVGSVDRHCGTYEVIEGNTPRLSASESDGWDGSIAEKKEGAF